MVSSLGLPPVRIRNALIVSGGRSRPDTVCQSYRACFQVKRTQRYLTEQFVESAFGIADVVEPAGRTRQQDDPRLGLKRMPQTPSSGISIAEIPKHHVQIFDDQHETSAHPVRVVLKCTQAPIPQHLVVHNMPQFLAGALQIGSNLVRVGLVPPVGTGIRARTHQP